ncbi:undecaprenyldiphospho-muramoylpentapeptide beta-N-acetylglucosaminyltransferase [Sinorhizobium medicae]|nr:undecaprenyldiphospho-muramoylpentapeptide beta-N-acetylglucosaminyltransferase [Sinorhizobium medicae]
MDKGIILLAAGGTGGHLFPAEALAHELKASGYSVHLVTDSRAERFAGRFPADEIHVVASATIGSKNPVKLARSAWKLWTGLRAARRLISRLKPMAVVGFGGYPTVPPLLAATGMGVPTIIHEQNAVMGRANKMLASRVAAIAGGFLNKMLASRVAAIAGGFLPEGTGAFAAKTVATGNPVRPAVLEAARVPYAPAGGDAPFHLVVFGGSQGAQFFSKAVPQAVCRLDDALRRRLKVTQQARPEDREGVIASYEKLDIPAEVSPFFTDMAGRIASAQLVICRSGASTVSEVSVIGRPAILVPYPYALDHDQAANAAALAAKGGARVIAQVELSAERLANILTDAMSNPVTLAQMAAGARQTGKPDAAARLLALLVEAIASGSTVAKFKETRS